MTHISTHDYALKLLARGFVSCPVLPGSKYIDFAALGFTADAAINDRKRRRKLGHTSIAFSLSFRPVRADEVSAWFRAAGDAANIGVVCGYNDLVVLDFDEDDAFDRFRKANPVLASTTPVEKTPNGYHVYLTGPADTFSTSLYLGLRKAGHVSGLGGFVTCAPSVLDTGRTYGWLPGQSLLEIEPKSVASLGELGISTNRLEAAIGLLNRPSRAGRGSGRGATAVASGQIFKRERP